MSPQAPAPAARGNLRSASRSRAADTAALTTTRRIPKEDRSKRRPRLKSVARTPSPPTRKDGLPDWLARRTRDRTRDRLFGLLATELVKQGSGTPLEVLNFIYANTARLKVFAATSAATLRVIWAELDERHPNHITVIYGGTWKNGDVTGDLICRLTIAQLISFAAPPQHY